jgi:hypothetical protein
MAVSLIGVTPSALRGSISLKKPYAHREADVNNFVAEPAHIAVLPNIKHPITDPLRSIQQRRRRKNRNDE